jgi:hypothetical protein
MGLAFDSILVGKRAHGYDIFTRSARCNDFTEKHMLDVAPQGPFLKTVLRLDSQDDVVVSSRALCGLNSRKRKNFVVNPDDVSSHEEVDMLLGLLSEELLGGVGLSFDLSEVVGVCDSHAHQVAWSSEDSVLKLILSRSWGKHLFSLQCIMREFSRSINRLQRTRSKNYIITKVPNLDVFIVVYPGSVLKLHGNPAFYQLIYTSPHSNLKDYCPVEERLSDDWVASSIRSVDVFRLENFCVCFDKVVMSVLAHFESFGWPFQRFGHYLECSNFGAFESLMMIEGKLSTATSLSAGRYILMNSLGSIADDGSCVKKVDGPIRSRLHAYGIRRLMLFSLSMVRIPKEKMARRVEVEAERDLQELLNVGVDIEVTLPPIFSKFKLGSVPLRAAICEVYLHMTYNKERANPTKLEFRKDWRKGHLNVDPHIQ